MKRALLLACGTYADEAFAPLSFPLSDVDQFEGMLRDTSLCDFDEVEVIRNPTKAEAHRAMERLTTRSAQDDFILLYFSGHGKLSRSGSVVLVFHDTEGAYLHSSGVLDDDLRLLFNQARARQKAIILDCCHSGAAGDEGFKRAAEDGLEALAQRVEGTFVLSASTKFQPAFERPELQGSALTTCLVEAVRSGAAAAPGAKVVTLSQLGEYVAREVPRRSPQQPKFWDHGGVGAAPFSKVSRRLDRAWADHAIRELRKRFARDQIDEETFDELRAALRGDLGPSSAPVLALIDDLVERRLPPMAFARRWLALQRPGAGNAVPPEQPKPPPEPQPEPEPESEIESEVEADVEPEVKSQAPAFEYPGAMSQVTPVDLAQSREPIDGTQFYNPGIPEGDSDNATSVARTMDVRGGSLAKLYGLSFIINALFVIVLRILGIYISSPSIEEMLGIAVMFSVPKAAIETALTVFILRKYGPFSFRERIARAVILSLVMVLLSVLFINLTDDYMDERDMTFAALFGLVGGLTFLAATRRTREDYPD